MATTFKRLNQEVLGVSPPSLGPTTDDHHDDQGEDSEEARMRAELWEEPGMPPTPLLHLQHY